MHTVELLEQAILLAERCGFIVRQDWFGGLTAGGCELKGRRWMLIDLSLTAPEQLAQVTSALQSLPIPDEIPIPPQLRESLKLRRAA